MGAEAEGNGALSEQQVGADDTIETAEPSFAEGTASTPSFERLAASLDSSRRAKTREGGSGTTLPGLQKPSPAPLAIQRTDAGHTQPFDRKILAGHATVVESLPSVIVGGEADRTQPASIAPFAIDVAVEPGALEAPPEAEREPRLTVRIRKSTFELRQIRARWIVGAVALVAGGILALALIRPSSSVAPNDAVSATRLTSAELPAPRPEVPEQPHAEPSLVPVTGAILTKKTGTLVVDGDKKRIEDGRVVVTCGKHRLGAGKRVQSIVVPCGGTMLAK